MILSDKSLINRTQVKESFTCSIITKVSRSNYVQLQRAQTQSIIVICYRNLCSLCRFWGVNCTTCYKLTKFIEPNINSRACGGKEIKTFGASRMTCTQPCTISQHQDKNEQKQTAESYKTARSRSNKVKILMTRLWSNKFHERALPSSKKPKFQFETIIFLFFHWKVFHRKLFLPFCGNFSLFGVFEAVHKKICKIENCQIQC